ncbi:hypothetical protein CL689_00430 [Candidatus Saccharibacteria bacterium]|nr:hypothetical protein [Candidatus Saccharibacteria bacterium]MBJ58664.1 hypothetical protein [Candidatus Saccharibacteria bacterium]MBQ68515.1 hypothetical protein [Candidatus Saccharibacteria bacterium]|tara:strand:+ start:89 stop:613 length:525 start_codon:yes stop_codon:yes gene_type:complete
MFIVWLLVAVIALFAAAVLFGAPYVPSQRRYLRRALTRLYPVDSQSVVVDIGAGDGVVLREVSRRGGRAIGYEINPILWLIARWLSRSDERVKVHLANFWMQPLPADVTMVYAFSVKRDSVRLIKRLRSEATRLERPIALLCLGSPLPAMAPIATLDAYLLYEFHPSQSNMLTV